ncbi:MAG: mechanosensitive ion channel [Bacteroidota bacterium]|nr:mechanosensitive ion channel [Bacteroidota bacterium]
MKDITSWTDLMFSSFQSFGQKFVDILPNLVGAIIILILGWLIAKLFSAGIHRLLKLSRFDQFSDKIKFSEFLAKSSVTVTPSKLVSKFIYWILILFVIVTASDTMGWSAVSKEISKLIGYLPNLLISIIIFVTGSYIATFIRNLIKGATGSLGISSGKLISSVVFYLIIIVVTLTALEQLGINTYIISSNLLIISGAILLTAAISYGFASKELLSNILASFFSRKTFSIGKTIEFDGAKGKIIAVNNISVTIENEKGEKFVIPSHLLISNRVKMYD